MYSLVRNLHRRQDLLVEGTACLASFVIAELFFKFHSFTLECAAFLATWFSLSYVLTLIVGPKRSGTRTST